jgi:hypothetical protein
VRAGFLDTANGRWLSDDLLGFEGGDWNLYAYVLCNPTTLIDPRGLVARGEVLYIWFFENDKPKRMFGPNNQVTADIRALPSIDSCRRAWLAAGCHSSFRAKKNKAGKGAMRQELIAAFDIARIQLLLGSFNLEIHKIGKSIVRFAVRNTTGWESFYRNPFTHNPTLKNELRNMRRGGRLRSSINRRGSTSLCIPE